MCSFGSGRHVQDNNKTNDIMQKKREVTQMTTVSCHDSLCVTFAKHNNGQLHVAEHCDFLEKVCLLFYHCSQVPLLHHLTMTEKAYCKRH